MGYRIEQTDRYLGKDNWEWRAWIDASESELDAIDRVVWRLHPTYADPSVESRDRSNRFAIERTAWGRFQLGAAIEFKDGSPARRLRRQLQLWYPEETAAPSEEEASSLSMAVSSERSRPGTSKVFVSYGTEDRHIADAVTDTLQRYGFEVSRPDHVSPGMPWLLTMQKMLRESDLVLGIVSSDFASPQVVTELNNARQAEKPILTLVGPDVSKVYGLDTALARSVADPSDPGFEDKLVGLVRQSLAGSPEEEISTLQSAPQQPRIR